jgi:hypothetical protein
VIRLPDNCVFENATVERKDIGRMMGKKRRDTFRVNVLSFTQNIV